MILAAVRPTSLSARRAIATDRWRDRLDEATIRFAARLIGTLLLAGGIATSASALVMRAVT